MMSRILTLYFIVALLQPWKICNGEVSTDNNSPTQVFFVQTDNQESQANPDNAGLLIDLARSQDLRVSNRAVGALGLISPTKKEIVKALTLLTKSSSPTIRLSAVTSLGQIGQEARSALPNLESIARSGNGPIARKAAEVVALIGDKRSVIVADHGARAALSNLPQVSEPKQLETNLKPNETGASTAIGAEEETETVRLAKIKSIDVADISLEESKLLISALKDSSSAVKMESLLKLSRKSEATGEEAKAVEESLTDSEAEVRETAFRTLTKMGNEGMKAMVSASTSSDLSIKLKAIKGLRNFDRTLSTEAVIQLKQNLSDANESVRAQSAVTLGMANSLPNETIPLLIRSIEGDDLSAAVPATVALSKFNADAVRPLAFALDSQNPKVRSRAATALGLMDPTPEQVVELLSQLLQDESSDVRASAEQALKSIRATEAQEEE